MWHRIRLTGGALQAGSEQDRVLRKIHSWVTLNGAVELSKFGRPLTHEDAEIYSYWDGDDKVWHLNGAALKVYRAVGGARDVEAAVASAPSAPGRVLLLSTKIFSPT